MEDTTYQVLITAAGRSRRMHQYKPLLPLGEKKILEHTISRFLESGITNITVVTGHNQEALLPLLESTQVQQVFNPFYATEDMFCSIRTGVAHICKNETPKGLFICPGDIPLIHPLTIRRMIRKMEETEKRQEDAGFAILPFEGGHSGHPPLLSGALLQDILTYSGTSGLGGLLRSRNCISLETADPYIHMDADTPEDYKKLLDAYETWDIPSYKACKELFSYAQTPQNVIAHGEKVAQVALRAAEAICKKDPSLRKTGFLELVQASGLLHDLLRTSPCHAAAGARFLTSCGYKRVALPVAAHKNLLKGKLLEEAASLDGSVHTKTWEDLTAAFLLYLADRQVNHTEKASYEEKYKRKKEEFQGNPEALQALEWDKSRYFACKKFLKAWTGCDVF